MRLCILDSHTTDHDSLQVENLKLRNLLFQLGFMVNICIAGALSWISWFRVSHYQEAFAKVFSDADLPFQAEMLIACGKLLIIFPVGGVLVLFVISFLTNTKARIVTTVSLSLIVIQLIMLAWMITGIYQIEKWIDVTL